MMHYYMCSTPRASPATLIPPDRPLSPTWHVPKVLRYEIRDIAPPRGVKAAMELQAEAERRKRAQARLRLRFVHGVLLVTGEREHFSRHP